MTWLLAVEEGVQEQLSTEEIPWGIDMTKRLVDVEGASVSSPSSELIDLATGGVVELADEPTIDEGNPNVIVQQVGGSVLAAAAAGAFPHKFRLVVSFELVAGNVQSTYVDLLVRF